MIDSKPLLKDLQKQLKVIEKDLSQQASEPHIDSALRQAHKQAKDAGRTAKGFDTWRKEQATQVGSAWLLAGVFVRFLEDNRLIDPPRLAGSVKPVDRLSLALDARKTFIEAHPTRNNRDYLLSIFDDLAKVAAAGDVFGQHNPLREVPTWLSDDSELWQFLRKTDPQSGDIVHDYLDPQWNTRFLGDLYQDLSKDARKRFALLQTPGFVLDFILDHTLTPALDEFGLAKPGYESRLDARGRLDPDDQFRLIDPASGSGHFLLASFERLFDQWRQREPGANPRDLAQRALDSVYGVDINPYAAAIARFRLLLAAMKAAGVKKLSDAPNFQINVACGDSLLHGMAGVQHDLPWQLGHNYFAEDKKALERILRPGAYHAVVANPPYIAPPDKKANENYRRAYSSVCAGKYTLAVPFMKRLFDLAVPGGFVGKITSDAFMKREFGGKLIENYLPRIDLTHIVSAAGVPIPGHNTPTVILFGRSRAPVLSVVRTVMGIKGDKSHGAIWAEITTNLGRPDFEGEFVSIADVPRERFGKHPWSMTGGGASDLKDALDRAAENRLGQMAKAIGLASVTGQEEVYPLDPQTAHRLGVECTRELAHGEGVRDWQLTDTTLAPWMYDGKWKVSPIGDFPKMLRLLWPYRSLLACRKRFGTPILTRGMTWYEWQELYPAKLKTPLAIAFAFVSTHNQFILDRGGTVFNRSAPLIKLPENVADRYLSLLGLLNSSAACFWMKQVSFPKGGNNVGQEGARVRQSLWDIHYEFTSTGLKEFPLPAGRPLDRATQLDTLGRQFAEQSPAAVLRNWTHGKSLEQSLADAAEAHADLRGQMVAVQEELDWECYELYGLNDAKDGLLYHGTPPCLSPGQRAFEIVMARLRRDGKLETAWFTRHGTTAITEPPADWPADYRDLVNRRIARIEANRNVRLIEQPEYKRRWSMRPFPEQQQAALRSWLLDRLESYFDADGRMNPAGTPTARLEVALCKTTAIADVARKDAAFKEVARLYNEGRDDYDIEALVDGLVRDESVPLLPVLRYSAAGRDKRKLWEETWRKQRLEDALDARTKLPEGDPKRLSEFAAIDAKREQVGTIEVPPRYERPDFARGEYWGLRGELDVPKERWVSFPHSVGPDKRLVVGWAGWDHLQLANAIATHYTALRDEAGREDPRLTPLLACLTELLPWLKQWHNEVDEQYQTRIGDYYEGHVELCARERGLTRGDLRNWQPDTE